jgi:hypothetical protein
MFKPLKHVLNKKNMFKTKNNVLLFCFLPPKNHGFALGHLQASFYVLHMFKDVYEYVRGGQL